MPELPELEALRRSLDGELVGQPVTGAEARSPSILKTYSPPLAALTSDRVRRVDRRGKWLLAVTEAGLTLGIHLMTGGRLRWTDGRPGPARADAFILRLADGRDLRVGEIGTRKQSAVHLVVGDGSELVGHLGPDPLEHAFSPAVLASALRSARHQLKPALVDQRIVAGIGNAWADEMLHEARLSPMLMTDKVSDAQVESLHLSIMVCTARGIAEAQRQNYLTLLRGENRPYLRVHGRGKQPCPDCGQPLADIWKGERTTTYCPDCQTDGRVYADRRLSRLLR